MQHIIKNKRDTHKNCFDHSYVRDVYHCKITFVYDDFSYNISHTILSFLGCVGKRKPHKEVSSILEGKVIKDSFWYIAFLKHPRLGC